MTTTRLRIAAATLVTLLGVSCGGGDGGGGGTGAPPEPTSSTAEPVPARLTVSQDDDARRAVLADLGERLVLPTLRDVDDRAGSLRVAVNVLAAAPASEHARSKAQAAWRAAMRSVQRAHMLQVGPAAYMTEPGGLGLAMEIHAFPEFDACAIHNAAYAELGVDAKTPRNRIGMGALEYLLFSDADNPACLPSVGNAQAKRAQYAARVAARIDEVATQLRMAWEPAGGNFLGQFMTAGAGSTVYATPQVALNAISNALFYFEKTTKDRKIAGPTGIGATDIPSCLTNTCPQFLESPYSRTSGLNIQDNLQAFREIFTGADGGMGLNHLMQGAGRSDLVARFVKMLDAAAAGVTAGITPDMEANIAGIPNRNACLGASELRRGEPAVCAMHGLIDDVTDTLRSEVVSTLNLRIPDFAAGDND